MKILICNVGSTSLKYQLFDMDGGRRVLAAGHAERVGGSKSTFLHHTAGEEPNQAELPLPSHREAIAYMLKMLLSGAIKSLNEISCVGFKVVIAKGITGVQFLDETVLKAMEEYSFIAPAHNPPYIAAIRQFANLLPSVPLIGSFETGFHAEMPPEAYLYSLPVEFAKEYGIRRYGYHGASHEYISNYISRVMGRTDVKLVSCHLGGSNSLCAVKNGKSIDTSMGLSPQSGLMQNNRIGDIDAYITFFLMEETGLSLAEIKEIYQKKSGFFGMSGGISNDLRDIEEAADQGNVNAVNALRSFCYQIKKLIGSYAAAMGGLDAIAFAGGIGENSSTVRRMVCQNLEFLGIKLDEEKNKHAEIGSELSVPGSPVHIYVTGTNEELVVAEKAAKLLSQQK